MGRVEVITSDLGGNKTMTAKVNLGTSDMKSVTMNLGTYDMQAKMNAKGFDVRDCPKEDYPMFEDEYKDW